MENHTLPSKPTTEQLERLFHLIAEREITKEALEQFISDAAEPRFRKRYEGAFALEVDYDMSFEQMVEAGIAPDRWDFVNQNIKAHPCSVEGKGKKKFQAELLYLQGKSSSTTQILFEAERRGLVRPRPEHLMAFAAQKRHLWQVYHVVGLFEEKYCWWQESQHRLAVLGMWVYLHEHYDQKNLQLLELDRVWCSNTCFLFLHPES